MDNERPGEVPENVPEKVPEAICHVPFMIHGTHDASFSGTVIAYMKERQ